MRPEAHIAAAIPILDEVLQGASAEQSLTNWARNNRYAGSSDRAAVRDLVFDALRRKRSLAWRGGSETGRGLMIGRVRSDGHNVDQVFTGKNYAPQPLVDAERTKGADVSEAPEAVQLDCPDWALPMLSATYSDNARDILSALQTRASVFLRVNTSKTTVEDSLTALAKEDIAVERCDLASTALRVTRNERRVRQSKAYQDGLVELQDAASQAVVEFAMAQAPVESALDFCAGGGGKALAIAGLGAKNIMAHDADAGRMKDIPTRAKRAGVTIDLVSKPSGTFDLVLCDAPCSGSGAWRRQPQAKWAFSKERLSELQKVQVSILEEACQFVGDAGVLAYATCSLFSEENTEVSAIFTDRNPEWHCTGFRQWTPIDGADGFFCSVFRKS